jgi:hypothetical protein
MRLVLRMLLFEFALSWAMVLAGSVRVAMKTWPFVRGSLTTRLQSRTWRVGLGLMIAIPVVAGWPALFLPDEAKYAGGNWLKIAVPWWIVIGVLGAEMLVARLTAQT